MTEQEVVDKIFTYFNRDFVYKLAEEVKKTDSEIQLLKLDEGILWHIDDCAVVLSPERCKELEETGSLKIWKDK